MKKLQPPKSDLGEIGERALKGLASCIPGIGGLLAEYIDYCLPRSLSKRRDLFLQEIASRLNELSDRKLIELEDISNNDLFATIIYRAINESLKVHENEKRQYLKNGVINTAMKININQEIQERFINILSQLTLSHIHLLSLFQNLEVSTIDSYEGLFKLCEKDFNGNRDEFRMFIQDLLSYGFINISKDVSDFDDVVNTTLFAVLESNKEAPYIRITNIGENFLQYIASTSN